ncbi:hypothetical protein HDU81_007848 [Chytriomyces hyalinus]|nr:hypothetical protein HDU81_007848 [Chytriomyces hyalinus]
MNRGARSKQTKAKTRKPRALTDQYIIKDAVHNPVYRNESHSYVEQLALSLRLRGTVLPSVAPVVLIVVAESVVVAVLFIVYKLPVNLDDRMISMMGSAIAMLLAFRTNRSFERYNQGSQLWTHLAAQIRNCSRLIWNSITPRDNAAYLEKYCIMQLLLATAVATKHALRGADPYNFNDLLRLLPDDYIKGGTGVQSPRLRRRSSASGAISATNSSPNGNVGSISPGITPTRGRGVVDNNSMISPLTSSLPSLLSSMDEGMTFKAEPTIAMETTDPHRLSGSNISKSNKKTRAAAVASEALCGLSGLTRLSRSKEDASVAGQKNGSVKILQDRDVFQEPRKIKTRRSIEENDPQWSNTVSNSGGSLNGSLRSSTTKYAVGRASGTNIARNFLGLGIPQASHRPPTGSMINVPLDILHQINQYVRRQRQSGDLVPEDSSAVMSAISNAIDSVTKFEQILYFPVPTTYEVHIKHVLLLYFTFLPFQLVKSMGWAMILATFAMSITFFGIDAIAGEIAEPFGTDENDLPLDYFCHKLQDDMEYIMDRHFDIISDEETEAPMLAKKNFRKTHALDPEAAPHQLDLVTLIGQVVRMRSRSAQLMFVDIRMGTSTSNKVAQSIASTDPAIAAIEPLQPCICCCKITTVVHATNLPSASVSSYKKGRIRLGDVIQISGRVEMVQQTIQDTTTSSAPPSTTSNPAWLDPCAECPSILLREARIIALTECIVLKPFVGRGFEPDMPVRTVMPTAPVTPVSKEFCKYWINSGGKCPVGATCPFMHPPVPDIPDIRKQWLNEKRLKRYENAALDWPDPTPMSMKQNHSARASVFAKWIVSEFGLDVLNRPGSGVFDIAGGSGRLSMELMDAGVNKCTVIDSRPFSMGAACKKWIKKRRQRQNQDAIGTNPHDEDAIDENGNEDDEEQDDDDEFNHETEDQQPTTSNQAIPDIESDQTPRQLPFNYIRQYFMPDSMPLELSQASLIVGLHPDQATGAIVEAGIAAKIPFVVVPCCVFKDDFPERKLRDGKHVCTTLDLVQWIKEKLPDGDVCTKFLDFQGKNMAVYCVSYSS